MAFCPNCGSQIAEGTTCSKCAGAAPGGSAPVAGTTAAGATTAGSGLTDNMAGALAASLTALVYGGLFDRGYWSAPFFVSAGVLFLGALIWIFLIDPEKSVVA